MIIMTDLLFINPFFPPKVLETPKTHYAQYNDQMYLNGTGFGSCMEKNGILGVFFLRII